MNPGIFTMRFWSRSVTGYLSNGLGSATFFLIAFALLAGGCNHPRSQNDGSTTVPSAVSRLSQTLVGKRITVRGKLFTFKCGQAIQLDDEEIVCLINMPSKSVYEDPYSEMYDKLVEATGTLRFYHNPTPVTNEPIPTQREQDHYYFEIETTQVRLVTN